MNDPAAANKIGDVIDTVTKERRARDMAQWEVMRGCFAEEDSIVDVSWTKATGPRFVELSRQSYEAGSRSVHLLGPVSARVQGDRATADVGALIEGQVRFSGVPCSISSFGRILERLVEGEDGWRICALEVVYQFDKVVPVNPGDSVHLDKERLERYRPSYKMLSYMVAETQGEDSVRMDLPGIDRPELVEEVFRRQDSWLRASN